MGAYLGEDGQMGARVENWNCRGYVLPLGSDRWGGLWQGVGVLSWSNRWTVDVAGKTVWANGD